jgi:hypothetical protein
VSKEVRKHVPCAQEYLNFAMVFQAQVATGYARVGADAIVRPQPATPRCSVNPLQRQDRPSRGACSIAFVGRYFLKRRSMRRS